MRRAGSHAAVLLVVGILASTVWAASAPTPAGAGRSDLPPASYKALTKTFRAELEPYGVKMTRALLQSLTTYERDPDGTHLALYVEPVDGDYTNTQYVKSFTRLTREFVPRVFKRWKGLESFDICQEPYADPRESPPPLTQIFVTRDALDRVGSWRRATLAELLRASPRVRSVAAGYYVYFAPSLQDEPAYVKAVEAAGWTTPPSSAPSGR